MKKATLIKRETVSVKLMSDVIVVKEKAIRMAKEAGFDGKAAAEIAISAAELATNIAKHAGAGFMHFQVNAGHKTTIWVTAEDHGRGIESKEKAVLDFHTDRGSVVSDDGFLRPLKHGIGCGLSAVKRLMDSIEISSNHGCGTVVIAGKSLKHAHDPKVRAGGALTRHFHAAK